MTGIDNIGTIVMRHFGINDGTAPSISVSLTPGVKSAISAPNPLLTAARNVAARLDRQLTAATIKEAKDIRDAVASHSSVVEHYWQNRHRLQRQCEAMDAIIAVLEEGAA